MYVRKVITTAGRRGIVKVSNQMSKDAKTNSKFNSDSEARWLNGLVGWTPDRAKSGFEA